MEGYDYCPNCYDGLTEERKKLGKGSNLWKVCKSCGYRAKANDTENPDNTFIEESKRINSEDNEEYYRNSLLLVDKKSLN